MTTRDPRDMTEADQARLARTVMRRQGGLSLRIAALFLILILGLPLLNALAPGLMNTPIIADFTPTWLFLGVLFYPITVALSAYFVAESDRIEAELASGRPDLGGDTGAGGAADAGGEMTR